MSILSSELKLYRAANNTDTTACGGRMTANEVVSGTLANLFAHVLPEELAAGSTKWRKAFFKVANDDDLPFFASKLFLDAPTPGDDYVVMVEGSQRNTVGDLSSPRIYGVAFLSSNVSAGASTLIVDVENAAIAGMFQDGDQIVITDKLAPAATSGNREVHTIDGTPSVSGTQVTIAISGTLANAYTTAANARVSSVLDAGDVACSVDNWVETSAAGTYDESASPVVCDNIGTNEQTWTLTFSDATTFTVVGDTVGSVGSGTMGSNFAPTNPDFEKPYFTLAAAGWGGTWAAGDTIVFQTHPAAPAMFFKRVTPAGATGTASNRFTVCFLGATA